MPFSSPRTRQPEKMAIIPYPLRVYGIITARRLLCKFYALFLAAYAATGKDVPYPLAPMV